MQKIHQNLISVFLERKSQLFYCLGWSYTRKMYVSAKMQKDENEEDYIIRSNFKQYLCDLLEFNPVKI